MLQHSAIYNAAAGTVGDFIIYRPPWSAFCQARRTLVATLDDWLDTEPSRDDVVLELYGTVSALRQKLALWGGAP